MDRDSVRLRLLSVAVQPTFVVDDGEELTEVTTTVVKVFASDWPTFAANSFGPDDLALLTKQYQEANPPPPDSLREVG